MTPKQSLARLGIVAVVCGVAVWGAQFLPEEDYQPSRPLYAFGWLLVAMAVFAIARHKWQFASSVAFMLTLIFGALLLFSLFL